ncbi:unnamed protein product, partial [marine sediment metagenome]
MLGHDYLQWLGRKQAGDGQGQRSENFQVGANNQPALQPINFLYCLEDVEIIGAHRYYV